MKKLLFFIISAFILTTLNAQVTENFSDYTVGGKLAQQAQEMGRDYWDTWSGSPGSDEDGVVAEYPAGSGNKALFLNKVNANGNDQLLHLGQQTSGTWYLTFKILVPATKNAYFNVQANFTGGQDGDWAFETYFACTSQAVAPQGTGSIRVGNVASAATFTFEHDTWVDVEVYMNMDDDEASLTIGGNLVHTWVYSVGASHTDPGSIPRVIDAFNMYPAVNTATSSFYIDDIVFAPAIDVIFQTNFDELSAGDYVAESYPTWFETWGEDPGSIEDALITTEQAQSQPHSAKLSWVSPYGGSDLVFLAGDRTSGVYTIDFDIYIPNNARAYFNLLQIFDRGNGGQDSEWAVGVFWNVTSAGGPYIGTYIEHNGEKTDFTFAFDTWIPVHFDVNLDDDIASISIDNMQILEWQYSITEEGDMGIRQLAAVDFFPPQTGGLFYIDNFRFAGSGGETFPIMDVTPDNISELITPGATVTKTITVENTGTSIGDFFTWVELDIDPVSGTNNYVVTYSSDSPGGGVGYADECTVEVAAKYTSSFYCDKMGTYINKVAYYMYQASADNKLTARVYGVGAYNSPGDILAEVTIDNPIVGAWNEITLSTPVLLDGQDFWVAFEMIQPALAYLMAYDDGNATENSNWTRRNGSSWSQMFTVGNDPPQPVGRVMVKAFTQGKVVPGCWLTFDGESYGTVPKNSSKTFDVVLNATGLDEGVYTATIFVATNDPDRPLFTIPCVATVGTSSFMTVNPTSILELIHFPDEELTVQVTITNIGNMEGNYAVEPVTVDWLALSGATSGTLEVGENDTFNVTFTIDSTFENKNYITEIKVTTSDANGSITIPCTLIVTGIGVGEYKIQTLVFPNPASGDVHIESNTSINSIQLYNNAGQMVYSSTVSGDRTTFNTSNFSAGYYFIKIITNEGTQNVKLLVQ